MATGELTRGGYEMLQAAVNASRDFQCRSVKGLRDRLAWTFPGREADINEAIEFWRAEVRERNPNGVSSL